MTKISVVVGCYNEEENIQLLYHTLVATFTKVEDCEWDLLFIDNGSKDKSRQILHELAESDLRVKVIFNVRNFGHIRSPYYGMLQSSGDAVVAMACDFQDPPELIPRFIAEWRAGFKCVLGVKKVKQGDSWSGRLRKLYYRLTQRLSDTPLYEGFTGFGLYDRDIIEWMRRIDDPYPYFRGLIADLGYPAAQVPFEQPPRKHGSTKNNFYTLYDLAMLGITSHSKVPLRLATMLGFMIAFLSLFVAVGYFIAKLLFWNYFSVGIAPVIIAIFFFSAVQLIFIGIVGEYVGAIHTQVMKRPLVVEQERFNFESKDDGEER